MLAVLALHDQSHKHLMCELVIAACQENLPLQWLNLFMLNFLPLPPEVAITLASVEHDRLQNLANKAHYVLLLKRPNPPTNNLSLAVTTADDISHQMQQVQLSKL